MAPEMTALGLLREFGSVAGVLVIAMWFLRAQHVMVEDRKSERESFVAAVNSLSEQIGKLSIRIEHCPSRRHNGRPD